MDRRLAAIMAADIVGYSRMIEHDEAGTVQRLRALRTDFIDPLIDSHHGNIVRLAGDGALVEFPSVVEAAQCAVDLQRGMRTRNQSVPQDQQIVFRIGVNLGDIVVEDDNLHGDGINVAARLEALAEPGAILVAEQVAQNVEGKIDAALAFVEERSVKNIERPVRVYQVLLDDTDAIIRPTVRRKALGPLGIAVALAAVLAVGLSITWWRSTAVVAPQTSTAPVTTPRLALPEYPSIVVLPFSNMSGDPDQDYFADGMTDDLITDLSKISGLFVIARNSAFAYRGKDLDVKNVAAELGVKYVLEGSVRRSGSKLRINAQLIDSASGGHLWAERYDGTLDDVFSLQDSINRRIVSVLAVKLSGEDRARLEKTREIDARAYDVLLRGFDLMQRFNPEDNAGAREFFKEAVQLDQGYARAYANVALTYANDAVFNWVPNPKESIRMGLEYAAKAALIDESIPQIYFTRASLYVANREHDAAIAAAKRSLSLHPNYADAHAMLAFVGVRAGELDMAIDAIHRAKRLNPRYTYIYLALEGHARFLQGHYRQALPLYEQALERNPSFDRGHLIRAAIHAYLDEPDEATWSLEEALAINPHTTLSSERDSVVYKRQEDVERYITGLEKAGLK